MDMKTAVKAISILSLAALAGCMTSRNKPAPDTLIAHRGESVDAPENTLPAYKLAVERGFGFECDLYLSKDGRVFTFHDRTLTRTTGGANTNRCSDVTWKDTLSKIDVGNWGKWNGSKFAGTPPALLEDVLALARNGRQIYLEIKAGPEIVPVIKAILAAQNRATPRNVLFIAFNKEVCKAIKELIPEYTVYWLVTASVGRGAEKRPITADEVIAGIRESKADGVDMLFDPDVVDEAFVAAVKKEGFGFHVWTVDELPLALRAFAVGVETVTTNRAKGIYDEYAMLYAPEPDTRDAFSDRDLDGAAFPMPALHDSGMSR